MIWLCQCPQAGLFISTWRNGGRLKYNKNCVNALKRAYSFLHFGTGRLDGLHSVSMPSSGLIHFYGRRYRWTMVRRVVSMPSSGLIHFYGQDYGRNYGDYCVNALKRAYSFLHFLGGALWTIRKSCQCPQAGLFISTVFLGGTCANSTCVNALKRAYSFLLCLCAFYAKNRRVSMPSSGLIHFYIFWEFVSVIFFDLCQCPQAGLFISTVSSWVWL